MTAALALLQEVTFKTPDTTGYARAGYLAIGALLVGYTLFLWFKARKTDNT
jgi:hypothetical protein